MCWLTKLFRRGANLPSPSDIVPKASLTYNTGILEIKLDNLFIPFTKPPKVWLSSIPGTRSMDPVFDTEHNNIYIQGADSENQKILVDWLAKEWLNKKMANIIVYRIPSDFRQPAKIYAVHRLSRVEIDGERKWYFKGDNNITEDPYPAKDENILWVCVGSIY